jgi:predicted transcriptional regulator
VNVIISIKPKYVSQILSGNKRYEYRKLVWKKAVDKVYVYSSAPEKKIVGYFPFIGYHSDGLRQIWRKTKIFSGTTKAEYEEYFKNKQNAYAIIITKFFMFNIPYDPFINDHSFTPPQSFRYIEGDIP